MAMKKPSPMYPAFQAGCRHRLARRVLPDLNQLRCWGYSAPEAQQFEGGYTITRQTQEVMKGGERQIAAEREVMHDLRERLALNRVRQTLARQIARRAVALSDGEPAS